MKQFVFLCALVVGLYAGATPSTEPKQKAQEKKYHRGRVASDQATVKARHEAAFKRHGQHVKHLRIKHEASIPDSFDCRTAMKNVLPTDDQGQCGDCFGVSAADACSMALILAGKLPLDTNKGRLSSQYGLDNRSAFEGGCNGGDEAQVIEFIKTQGFPLTSDYGPYTASPGRPKPVGTVYKIKDWGYCTQDQQQGVASTADVQVCMMKYGPISVAFDASGCDGYQAGQVMTGRGNNVDHAVLCIGWKTQGGKVIFLGLNQWGASWGDGGTFWITEGSYSWCTEAIWIDGGGVAPPVPPDPVPPQPLPPGAVNTITWTINGVTAEYELVPVGTFDAFEALRKKLSGKQR